MPGRSVAQGMPTPRSTTATFKTCSTTYCSAPGGVTGRNALRTQLQGQGGLTPNQIAAKVKGHTTANEDAMQAEMDNHLNAVAELWAKTRASSLATP